MSKTDITVDFTHQDGNAFAILGTVTRAQKDGARGDLVEEFRAEATSGDYNNLLATVGRYVVVEYSVSDDGEECWECGGFGYVYEDGDEIECWECEGAGEL